MSEPTEADKQAYTVKVLTAFYAEQQNRLQRGLQLRKQMHAVIDAGGHPQGYRVEWIKATTRELNRALMKAAGEFNATHPDDRISTLDFLDVLQTAMGLYQKDD